MNNELCALVVPRLIKQRQRVRLRGQQGGNRPEQHLRTRPPNACVPRMQMRRQAGARRL